MLNLADRGFFSMDRWLRFSAGGADLAWRVKNGARSVPFRTVRALPDEIPGSGHGPDPLPQALATAALTSRRAEDFEKNLDRLREVGLDMETADVFREIEGFRHRCPHLVQ